jgi:hypothetical protein
MRRAPRRSCRGGLWWRLPARAGCLGLGGRANSGPACQCTDGRRWVPAGQRGCAVCLPRSGVATRGLERVLSSHCRQLTLQDFEMAALLWAVGACCVLVSLVMLGIRHSSKPERYVRCGTPVPSRHKHRGWMTRATMQRREGDVAPDTAERHRVLLCGDGAYCRAVSPGPDAPVFQAHPRLAAAVAAGHPGVCARDTHSGSHLVAHKCMTRQGLFRAV